MTMTTSRPYPTQRTSPVDAIGLGPRDAGGSAANPAVLLPEPAACGLCDGSMTELSMLLTQADEQDRAASRQIETTADQAATREENDRVAQLRAKAGDDESQALASGIAGIAGGVLTASGALFDKDTGGRLACEGAGQGLPGAGQIIAGQYKAASDRADADAARFDAQAQADIRRGNQAHDDAQAANQSIQKVEQFLDQVQQTENATRLTAGTFRG